MPLQPPPDYSKPVGVAIITLAAAICLWTITRSTLPHTGDNIHALPHGGCYRDGTKQIRYNSPRGNTTPLNSKLVALAAILAIIIALRLRGRRAACPCPCRVCRPEPDRVPHHH
ncbi:TPA_asm: triple gene block protein 2 [Cardamom virus X]|nr:TPA_asm: triple gene block protein 2 [Cardamom virus X]DAZ85795.1 TPA_asm: triple gene block protein 2 [Cardamom virus X]